MDNNALSFGQFVTWQHPDFAAIDPLYGTIQNDVACGKMFFIDMDLLTPRQLAFLDRCGIEPTAGLFLDDGAIVKAV